SGLVRTSHTCRLLLTRPEGWFPDGWDAEIESALVDAVTDIVERAGPGADWGSVRPVHLEHLVARSAPALARVFNRGPVPIGGDSCTIPQAAVVAGAPFEAPMGFPNMRMAVPTGDWSAARWALAGGQSGDPTSPHYDDQVAPWQASGIPIAWTSDQVAAAAIATLTLRP
ncbi:MAG TPA: penicillin acylase family protein, partial [Nitriliruptorales bacterium]